jgi:hypothetical protein
MCCSSSLFHRRSKLAQQYANSKQVAHPTPFSIAHSSVHLQTRSPPSPAPPPNRAIIPNSTLSLYSIDGPPHTRLYKGRLHQNRSLEARRARRDGNRIAPPAMSSLTDPAMMEGMMGGMKNQFVTMVPQMLIMGWVNFFFSGFVLSAFFPAFSNPRIHT